jgi:hypothetical protein
VAPLLGTRGISIFSEVTIYGYESREVGS